MVQTAHQTTTELRPRVGLRDAVAKCPAKGRLSGRDGAVRAIARTGEESGEVRRGCAPCGFSPGGQKTSAHLCASVGKRSPGAGGSAALVSTRISRRERSPRRLQPTKRGSFIAARGPGATQKGTCASNRSQSGPQAVLPRHVLACQHSHHPYERWAVWTWKRSAPEVQTRVPYSCGSWRCPVCCRHEAAVTFARIQEATARPDYAADGWVFCVLTIDRNGYYGGRLWFDVNEAYRSLGGMMERLLKRLRRAWGEPLRAWCAVVEAHRSGWPHVNLMLYAPELAAHLRSAKQAHLAAGATERESTLLEGDLLEHAEACGWGRQSTAEAARDKNAIAGYIVKLAGQHEASAGELAKITQAPTNAPERFRRLRSAKGFLPPRRTNPEITGALVRRRRSTEGDWQVLRVNPPHDVAQSEPTERAVKAELALIDEEEGILSRSRALPAMPPLRVAVGGQVESLKEATERRWTEKLRAFESA